MIFFIYFVENDEYVVCVGEINMNCYMVGVIDWKVYLSYFCIYFDYVRCFEREILKCDFFI